MSNDFYTHDDGYPAFNAQGASAAMRAQFDKIMAGFDKMPTLTGNGGKLLRVNALATGLEAFSAFTDTTDYNVSTLAHGLVPKLPGNTTTFLRGDGQFAVQTASSIPTSSRTSNTIITAADIGAIIDFTGSTNFTQTWTAPATIGSGFFCYLRNSGTADIEVEAPAVITTSSTTSNSIAAGTTWTVATGLAIATGDLIILRRTADPYNQRIVGSVSSYTSGTGVLIVTVLARVGSGTFTDWTITTRPSTAGFDGLASYVIYAKEARLVYSDGTAYKSLTLSDYYMSRTTSFTYIHPPGYSGADTDSVGGGGGAGAGARGAAGTARSGGAPGGTPAHLKRQLLGLTPGASYPVSIGAAGVGAAAQTVNDTAGATGTTGGNTSLSTIAGVVLAIAYGGIGGNGGTIGGACSTSSGAGWASVGQTGTGGLAGGSPISNTLYGQGSTVDVCNNIDGGGGGVPTTAGSDGGSTIWGGAGSAFPSIATTTSRLAGSSMFSVPAGGYGAWITTGNVSPSGGTAGARYSWAAGGGAAGGTSGGTPTAGANGAAAGGDYETGASGAGGGASTTGAAAAGGAGGFPGGAGGGGGASTNGSNSGAGGNGAAGRMVLAGVP